jgi:hypothetical protein
MHLEEILLSDDLMGCITAKTTVRTSDKSEASATADDMKKHNILRSEWE